MGGLARRGFPSRMGCAGSDEGGSGEKPERNLVHAGTKHISEERMQEMRDAFDSFDKDKSGEIDAAELKDVMTKLLGDQIPSDEELKDVLAKVDVNNDNKICFEEFQILMGQVDSDEDIDWVFKRFESKEGKGGITKEALGETLKAMGEDDILPEELDEIFANCDLDQDGVISKEEFVYMMNGGCSADGPGARN